MTLMDGQGTASTVEIDRRDGQMGVGFDAMISDLKATFAHGLRTQARTMVFGMVSVVVVMAALAFALARFT